MAKLYFTQLIYIKDGQENSFHEFENVAIPLIAKYRGELSLRIRLSQDNIIDASIEKPYEIHFGYFENQVDFDNFLQDEERKNFLHLKEQSIKSTVLITGNKFG